MSGYVPWSDAKYREAIRIQILVNKSEGNAEEIMVILGRAVAMEEETAVPTLIWRAGYPAGFEIILPDQLYRSTWGEKPFEYYRDLLQKTKGAGIKGQFWVNGSSNPFKFDTAGSGFDQGEFIGSLE